MVSLVQKLRRDERGMSFVMVGMGFMAFMAATTLAIDVGMLMTARNQAQNAADAGALAGATALAFNDFTNRASNGPAVQNAIQAAMHTGNAVMGQPVSVTPGDVTFPNDPAGQPNWIQVSVLRGGSRGNPVSTLVAGLFGIPTTTIGATATAEATRSNAETCVKPWTIPDKWQEAQTPPWDTGDTFSAFPSNPSVFPDVYRTASLGTYTGYTTTANTGQSITLTPVITNTIKAPMYFSVRLPGNAGAQDFTADISGCDSSTLHFGDPLTTEPAATAAATAAGAAALIALDPTAYWDSTNKKVVTTLSPSPRVVVIPLYDPLYFDQGKKVGIFTQLRVSNFMGFFIDHLEGTNVVGRITPVLGLVDAAGASAPIGSFPRTIRLVQ